MSNEPGQRITINSWLEEELYQQFVNNRRSVDENWKEVFQAEPAPAEPVPENVPPPALAQSAAVQPALVLSPAEQLVPLRGAPMRIAENMTASLAVPTATSQRTIPVKVIDENRRLLRQLFEYRKEANPKVTGVEALYASLTAQFVDKREHNEMLKKVLAALPARQVNRQEGVRFMTIGSENDDIAFMAMVESVGSTIVIDDQCSGTRYFWNASKPEDDVIKAIADRYCDRPACPTKDYPNHTRFDHVLGLAKEFNARAAIFLQQKFCDPHEGDYPDLKEHLEKNGIPTLFLEFDITNPIGPFRIRIEAFLETMSDEELF